MIIVMIYQIRIQIFTDELFLIKDISMKSIWDSDISEKTKENIWKYLQAFY